MSGAYQQYGGNPYGQAEAGYGGLNQGGAQGGHGASNPYGGTNEQSLNPAPVLSHETSNYSQASQYSAPAAPPLQHGSAPLSQQDFLARIDGAKSRINLLSSNIQEIASIHQRLLSTPDNRASNQLESIVSETQVRNTGIKDEIKFLERDASRESHNNLKRTQVESLKREFKSQLDSFYKEEADYSARYRDAIARQYRIVNPDATEEEVNEAANGDFREEGIFQQALKSNRSGQASSVLGAVRARHNDIQRIAETMTQLSILFEQLNEQVVYQEQQVEQTAIQTDNVVTDGNKVNEQLDKGIVSARRTRRNKWWCLLIVVIILAIVGLALGIYYGVGPGSKKNK